MHVHYVREQGEHLCVYVREKMNAKHNRCENAGFMSVRMNVVFWFEITMSDDGSSRSQQPMVNSLSFSDSSPSCTYTKVEFSTRSIDTESTTMPNSSLTAWNTCREVPSPFRSCSRSTIIFSYGDVSTIGVPQESTSLPELENFRCGNLVPQQLISWSLFLLPTKISHEVFDILSLLICQLKRVKLSFGLFEFDRVVRFSDEFQGNFLNRLREIVQCVTQISLRWSYFLFTI